MEAVGALEQGVKRKNDKISEFTPKKAMSSADQLALEKMLQRNKEVTELREKEERTELDVDKKEEFKEKVLKEEVKGKNNLDKTPKPKEVAEKPAPWQPGQPGPLEPGGAGAGALRCDICVLTFGSLTVLRSHLGGKKHMKRANGGDREQKPANNEGINNEVVKEETTDKEEETDATNWTPRPGQEREGRSSLVCPSCQEEVVTVSLEEHMDSHGFTPKSLMACTLCKEESPASKGLCRSIKTVVPVPDMFEHMKYHFTLISAFWKFPKDNGFVICPVCIVSTSKSKANPKGTSMKINNLAKHMLKIHGQDVSSKMVSGVTAPGCEGCGAKRVRMSEVGLHVRKINDAQNSQRCEKS